MAVALALVVAACGCDDSTARSPGESEATGRLIGVVADDEDTLPEGETSQTYDGGVVIVREAIESGTYRASAEAPLQVSYEQGEIVAKVITNSGGVYAADLEPGSYFVQAFYGDRSYSVDMLIEIHEDETTELALGLIHGV